MFLFWLKDVEIKLITIILLFWGVFSPSPHHHELNLNYKVNKLERRQKEKKFCKGNSKATLMR